MTLTLFLENPGLNLSDPSGDIVALHEELRDAFMEVFPYKNFWHLLKDNELEVRYRPDVAHTVKGQIFIDKVIKFLDDSISDDFLIVATITLNELIIVLIPM